MNMILGTVTPWNIYSYKLMFNCIHLVIWLYGWFEWFEIWLVSYPNFIWGPLFVGMRASFDHFKMSNTHCRGICKVPGCFGKKAAKNTKVGVNLSNTGGVLRKIHPKHSRRGGELINYGVRSEIFLKKPLGGNHLHFVKKWHLGHPGIP